MFSFSAKHLLRNNSFSASHKQLLTRQPCRDFRAAVLFHGNGVYDGTETTEAVSLLVGLSRLGAEVDVFAPNRKQAHVVNHQTGEE